MQHKWQRVMLMHSFSYGHVMTGECARVQYWRMEQEACVHLFHLRIFPKPVSVWKLSTIQLELKLNAHIYVVVDDGSTKDVTVIKMFRFEFVTLYKYRVSSFWVFGSNYDVLPFLLS